MTKVSVFGQQPTETKELKKIEFVSYLNVNREFIKANREFIKARTQPDEWDNIQLFSKSQSGNLDVMIAWDDDMKYKSIILGYWNDGVV